jgi:hypothetical protein
MAGPQHRLIHELGSSKGFQLLHYIHLLIEFFDSLIKQPLFLVAAHRISFLERTARGKPFIQLLGDFLLVVADNIEFLPITKHVHYYCSD